MLPWAFPFFFFNDTATTEIYTLSLHDALPISVQTEATDRKIPRLRILGQIRVDAPTVRTRSEEHTSELQSQSNIVCRLLLEKKKLTDLFVLVAPNRLADQSSKIQSPFIVALLP